MKKILKIFLLAVIAFLVIIQFFPPEKNDHIVNPMDDIIFHLDMSSAVKRDIVNACYDCHSNRTRYPFYNRFAPVSWMLARHIRQGKEKLNFSELGNYDRRTRISLLTAICDEIVSGEMPLKGFVIMHSKAVLNEKQVEDICEWADEAAEQVMTTAE
jgi:hypothetical protein